MGLTLIEKKALDRFSSRELWLEAELQEQSPEECFHMALFAMGHDTLARLAQIKEKRELKTSKVTK